MIAYFFRLRWSITATATNMRYRSYPWIKNTQNLSLQLGSTIFGVAVLKRKECRGDISRSSKKLLNQLWYRETFLGGGIFNRDDRVRPRSCLQPLFYQGIYILHRNGNSYVLKIIERKVQLTYQSSASRISSSLFFQGTHFRFWHIRETYCTHSIHPIISYLCWPRLWSSRLV